MKFGRIREKKKCALGIRNLWHLLIMFLFQEDLNFTYCPAKTIVMRKKNKSYTLAMHCF